MFRIVMVGVSDPYHFDADPDRIRGSASGVMDPDPGKVLEPDPDPT